MMLLGLTGYGHSESARTTCIGTAVLNPDGDWEMTCNGACSQVTCEPASKWIAGIGDCEYCPECFYPYTACCRIVCSTGSIKDKYPYGDCGTFYCDDGKCEEEVAADDPGDNSRYVAYCH